MKLAQSLTLAGFVMGMSALASPGCGDSGLVGGDCATGYTNCSNSCVNLLTDQHNCGSCGHACSSGVACIQGKCGGVADVGGSGWGGNGGNGGHYPDSSTLGGDGSSDAKTDQSVEIDGSDSQGGSTATAGGSSSAGAGGVQGGSTAGGASAGGGTDSGTSDSSTVDANPCVPPYDGPLHCGDCETVCSGDTPVCAPSAGSYACKVLCDPPLVNCFNACVDLNSDPDNCGTCGNVCPSRACQDGVCVGVQLGHFTAICMNYRTAPGTSNAQTTLLLGNAIFLPRVPTVRILAYGEYADPAVQLQVDTTIAAAASRVGQQFSLTRVNDSASVPPMLSKSNYDVFLVYEQLNAPAGALSSIGSVWASSLESFSYVGGVIVMLDGGQGIREMTELFTSTRLFTATGETLLSSSTILENRVNTDVVGASLVTKFPTQDDTCVFETSSVPPENTNYVITEPSGDAGQGRPVVVHSARVAPQG